MTSSHIRVQDSIATKLLRIILGLYFSITMLVMVLLLWLGYVHVKDEVREDMHVLQASFSSSLSDALWKFNEEQLKSLLKGLWENQVLVGVRINHRQEGQMDPQIK